MSGEDLSLLGLGIWLAAGLVCGIWTIRAQQRFLRLLEERRGTSLPRPEQMEWRVDLWFAQVPGAVSRLLRFMLQRQPEPDLERARRQMWHRARITLAVGVLGVSLPIILSYL